MKSVLITSSILILLLAALRPLLRGRIDPRLQYALWLVAALRLLVPVELADSAYSALALLDRAQRPAQIEQAIGQTHVPIPAQTYDDAYVQLIREYEQKGVDITKFSDKELEQVDTQARQRSQSSTLAELAEKYARPVWLGGAALAGLWFLLVNLRLRRKLGAAELALLEPSTKLPVFVSDALPSPCLCGTLRPKIYITPHAAQDPDRLRHVLAHESTHYRHRDHWWALLRCLCLCLYWFDPLVWWAAALSRQDCELACDAGAIRRLGEQERIPYGRTLVGMIAAGRCSLMQTATTMTGGKRRVRQRVRLIARKPKTALAVALALALVVGAAVGCTFTGAPEKTPESSQGLSADTLQERLLNLPEELRSSVEASASETKSPVNDIALASYWWDVPAEWESEQSPWLLDVHRWERGPIDSRGWPETNDEAKEIIAQDEAYYYVLEWPGQARFQMADAEPFTAAFETVRTFAKKTVLETEGVEPYAPEKNLDTLQARLMDVPEELRGEVISHPWPSMPIGLADYWLDGATDWDSDSAMGWLVSVRQWDQAQFEDWLNNNEPGNYQVFARDSKYYYAFMRPTGVEYDLEDAERYASAQQAIRAFAEKTVLETEGVEPYNPSAQPLDALQARLMDVPEAWRDKVSASPALGGEVSCLASYVLSDPKWAALQGGWLLNLYRMDEAGIQEKLDNGEWPAGDIFARSGDEYYALTWPSDGYQGGSDLSAEYWAAVNAMKDHVKATVLAAQGVEPFDPYTTPPHFYSNVPQPPLDPGDYAIDGMDYTLVTSYAQVPEDPEQWYLVGQMDGYPVWMFTRNYGNETMFQVEDRLTQEFPYRSGFFSAMSASGHAPRLKPLEGFGWGPKGTFGPFAAITHLFQGGTDQLYQLTVYDLGTDPAATAAYVHDWEPLMNDFNANVETVVHDDTHSVTISYQGASAEIQFDDINDDLSATLTHQHWDNVQQNGFTAETYEYCMNYYFNDDGAFELAMPVNPFTTDCIAVWTFRFTGSGFENTGFRFDRSSDTYTYISTVH